MLYILDSALIKYRDIVKPISKGDHIYDDDENQPFFIFSKIIIAKKDRKRTCKSSAHRTCVNLFFGGVKQNNILDPIKKSL